MLNKTLFHKFYEVFFEYNLWFIKYIYNKLIKVICDNKRLNRKVPKVCHVSEVQQYGNRFILVYFLWGYKLIRLHMTTTRQIIQLPILFN